MRALYCGPHKREGMVNVDQERRTCNRSKSRLFAAPLYLTVLLQCRLSFRLGAFSCGMCYIACGCNCTLAVRRMSAILGFVVHMPLDLLTGQGYVA